jgi:methyl-accepting chemotaxis protein
MPIQKIVHHTDLKTVAIGMVLILSLVAAGLTGGHIWTAYKNSAKAQKLSQLNDISDDIIIAAGFEAVERGVTAAALSANAPATPETIDKIKTLRGKGDKAINSAMTKAEDIADKEPDSEYSNIFKKVIASQKVLIDARERVDASLIKTDRDIQASEWIKTMTDFINTTARLRQTGFITTEPLIKITTDNLIIKQAVWLASEYAGLERANISTMIASQKQIPSDMMNKLQSFRSIVDVNIKEINTLKESIETDDRIINAINEMDEAFLNRFGEARRAVYTAGETSGIYPISAKEWIDKSTEGINAILKVSSAVTEVSKENAEGVSKRNRMVFWWFVLQTIVGSLISLALIIIIDKKVKGIWRLYESMDELSTGEGDLTFRLPSAATDEVGKTSSAFNVFMDRLQNIIRHTKQSANSVASAATQLSAVATQVEQSSTQQSHQADRVATAIEEMSASINEVAKNSSNVANFSREASEMAKKGEKIINDTVTGMQDIAKSVEGVAKIVESLGKSSEQIGDIVSLINDIADQTNLLALNAAIEAARAGEHGRGFAVVADEVRKLAEKTTKSTSEISTMIKTIQSDTKKAVTSMSEGKREVENGVNLAKEAGVSLLYIVNGSQKVTDMIAGIATASEEQSAVSGEISGNTESIARLTKENSSAVSQIAFASNNLLQLSKELQQMVGILKTE